MPFAKTALVSPNGTSREAQLSGDINHYNAVRLRVRGYGKIKMRLFSLDEVEEDILPDITLAVATPLVQRSLANFVESRAGLELKTTTINEFVNVNQIIIFSRFFASENPE